MSKTAQYRPSFSAEQVNHLLSVLSTLQDSESKKIYQKLAVFKTKISTGEKAAAYIATPKQSIEESLGMTATLSVESKAEKMLQIYRESPLILSDKETQEVLLYLHEIGDITEEEKEKGKQLELSIYGMDMGLFN